MDPSLDFTEANKKDNKKDDIEKKYENKNELAAPSKLITF